ncbi:MAG: zinc-binding dehydrogenase [Microcystaceae cyanobacterium]
MAIRNADLAKPAHILEKKQNHPTRMQRQKMCLVNLKPNQDLNYVNNLFDNGEIKPVLDGPYPLSKVPEMIQYFGRGKHKGKVVIEVHPWQ